jgi:hypothetical protein
MDMPDPFIFWKNQAADSQGPFVFLRISTGSFINRNET